MGAIARERRVWRELAQTHFTKAQIDSVLRDRPELISPGGGQQKVLSHYEKTVLMARLHYVTKPCDIGHMTV